MSSAGERRYNEDEISSIFANAAQRGQVPATTRAGSGLTLAELQQIGREVGLSDAAVAQAAARLDHPAVVWRQPATVTRRHFWLPVEAGKAVELPRGLTDEEWHQLVADLQTTFEARGRVIQSGTTREWHSSSARAVLQRSGNGERFGLHTTRRQGIIMLWTAVVSFNVAAVSFFVAAAGLSTDVNYLRTSIFAALAGVGIVASTARRLRAWARLARQQVDGVIARLFSTLTLLLVLLAPHTAGAQQMPGNTSAGRVRAVADSLAQAAIARDVMAGMVVFAQRGRDTLLLRAYGRADVENSVPMTTDHVFQFASITKQFTAAAVLKLVQEGRVALDAPIMTYLPAAPVRGLPITVRQLLAHTSGLPDYAESPRVGVIKRLDLPPDSLLALIAATPLYFEPGEFMRYSNTGFALLGQLIERVSGKPYAQFVEEAVLRPAGARTAHFCDPRALVMHIARGYTATPSGIRPADFISPHAPYAAGGFCGTVHDLAAWNAEIHARQGGHVLSSGVYREMVRPGTIRSGRKTRYGLGVGLSAVAGRRAFHHGGDIDGFTTFTAYLPDDSLNITVLINTQGPTRPDAVAGKLVEAALGAARVPTNAPPKNLAMFAGTYGDVEIAVTSEDGAPALRMKRGPMSPMRLDYVGRAGAEWVFTDRRSIFSFEAPAAAGGRSPAIWADLGVGLLRWERDR